MKKVLHDFIEALLDFAKDNCTINHNIVGNDYRARITANNNTLRLVIIKTDQCQSDTEEGTQTQIQQAQCEQLRNEFYRYVQSLDENVFTTTCLNMDPKTLAKLNTIIEETTTDPELISKAIEKFKALADTAIMDKVSELKSQMSNFKHLS